MLILAVRFVPCLALLLLATSTMAQRTATPPAEPIDERSVPVLEEHHEAGAAPVIIVPGTAPADPAEAVQQQAAELPTHLPDRMQNVEPRTFRGTRRGEGFEHSKQSAPTPVVTPDPSVPQP
jgi:hypothetical protein